jgi:hypothetical protein
MLLFQQYNQPINKNILINFFNNFTITLAKVTGGSSFARVVAAFSYSGASLLP